MRAVYSYKLFDTYWKKLDDSFYNVAKLSIKLAKVNYKTVLYCDLKTKDIFNVNGLDFDEYVIVDKDFHKINRSSSGLPKIVAALNEKEPYILLDLDTLIFSKLCTNDCVTYGYKESSDKTLKEIAYINEFYIKPYKIIESKVDIKLDWKTFPNNSLIVVNNPELVRLAYYYVLKVVDGKYNQISAQLYEQFLFYNYLVHLKADIGFMYETDPTWLEKDSLTLLEVISKRFTHINRYDKPKQIQLIKDLTELYNNRIEGPNLFSYF